MNATADRAVSVARGVLNGVRSDRVTFIAASLAYYALVSLIPLLILGVAAANAFGYTAAVEAAVADSVGPEVGVLVGDAIRGSAGAGGATVVGVAVLLWSGLKLFRGMDVAFSTVYHDPFQGGIVDQIRDGAIVLAAVGAGIAGTVAIGALIAVPGLDVTVGGVDLVDLVGTVGLLVGLTGAFLPLYYVLPADDISVREALPGAAFAAVGWTALQTGFRYYAQIAGSYQGYGALGAVLVLVTFLYVGGLVLLVGVVLNAVLADRMDETVDLDAVPSSDISLMPDDDTPADEPTDDRDDRDGVDTTDGTERRSTPADAAGPEGPDRRSTTPSGRPGPAGGGAPDDEDDGSDSPDQDDGRDATSSTDRADSTGRADSTDRADSTGRAAADEPRVERASRRQVEELEDEIDRLRERVREFENDVDDRTVHREDLESDLRRYVRSRVRRGHARGWGPYLVLLYGTAMTLGAFFYVDSGGWAIAAMIVIWLSTLGLYVLMLLVGLGFSALGVPGRVADRVRDFRD